MTAPEFTNPPPEATPTAEIVDVEPKPLSSHEVGQYVGLLGDDLQGRLETARRDGNQNSEAILRDKIDTVEVLADALRYHKGRSMALNEQGETVPDPEGKLLARSYLEKLRSAHEFTLLNQEPGTAEDETNVKKYSQIDGAVTLLADIEPNPLRVRDELARARQSRLADKATAASANTVEDGAEGSGGVTELRGVPYTGFESIGSGKPLTFVEKREIMAKHFKGLIEESRRNPGAVDARDLRLDAAAGLEIVLQLRPFGGRFGRTRHFADGEGSLIAKSGIYAQLDDLKAQLEQEIANPDIQDSERTRRMLEGIENVRSAFDTLGALKDPDEERQKLIGSNDALRPAV